MALAVCFAVALAVCFAVALAVCFAVALAVSQVALAVCFAVALAVAPVDMEVSESRLLSTSAKTVSCSTVNDRLSKIWFEICLVGSIRARS